MKITEKWLKEKNVCSEGLEWFLIQDETDPIKIIENFIKTKRYLDWANWLIVRIMSYKQYVSYAVYAAEQVLHIFEDKFPDDDRPRKAIEAAKKCVEDPSEENRKIAANAANAAANAAVDAAYSAYAAADAAAAGFSAHNVAFAARFAAAGFADYAADAAGFATARSVFNADAASCRKMQIKILRYGLQLVKGAKG